MDGSSQSGQNLGQYRLIEQIGRGGMATVFKAYQPSLDRYVAIKVLAPQYAADPDFAERFRREAKAVASLRHPNILTLHDYGEEGGTAYIVMEFLEGRTLKHLLGETLDLQRVSQIITQVASALDYAHQRGIVHRDVKPANVLLAEEGRVVLSDFGIAKIMEATAQLTAAGVGIGTPEYMSPEQGQGKPVDHRSDIYSLGVVLYEMLTGRTPFSADTPYAVIYSHIHKPLPLPHELNPHLGEPVERVILKALAKEPADRFQRAGELSQALNAALQSPGTIVTGPPPDFATSDRVTQLYAGARAAESAGRTAEALDLLTQVQRISPGYRDVAQSLERLRSQPLPPPQARAEEKRPEDIDGLYREAVRLMNLRHWEPARDLLLRVLAINPNQGNARAKLAEVERELATRPSKAAASQVVPKKGGFPRWGYAMIAGGAALVLICGLGLGLTTIAGFFGEASGSTATATLEPKRATAGPNEQPTESATEVAVDSTPDPAHPGVLFDDDFRDNRHNWTSVGGHVAVADGELNIASDWPDAVLLALPESSPEVKDFRYDATVTKVTGPDDWGYGLAFGITAKESSYYYHAFLVYGNGNYRVMAWTSDGWVEKVPSTPSPLINKGDATNELSVVAEGPKLSLYINGVMAQELQDQAGYHGKVGLFLENDGFVVTASRAYVTDALAGAEQTR